MEEECWIKENPNGFAVGTSGGPVAQIWRDGDWLYIETDPIEGCVMLNIETLPFLQKALARISKSLKE